MTEGTVRGGEANHFWGTKGQRSPNKAWLRGVGVLVRPTVRTRVEETKTIPTFPQKNFHKKARSIGQR